MQIDEAIIIMKRIRAEYVRTANGDKVLTSMMRRETANNRITAIDTLLAVVYLAEKEIPPVTNS